MFIEYAVPSRRIWLMCVYGWLDWFFYMCIRISTLLLVHVYYQIYCFSYPFQVNGCIDGTEKPDVAHPTSELGIPTAPRQ